LVLTAVEASPYGSVVTGPCSLQSRGLPTALPAAYRLALHETVGLGSAVMSGLFARDHSRAGQRVHPTRNFAL